MSNEQVNTNKIGEVRIADDVVAVIAAIAATETKGVYAMAGNITNELVGKFGVKNLSKGVKVVMEGNAVCVDMALIAEYGYSIPDTAKKVQDKVTQLKKFAVRWNWMQNMGLIPQSNRLH